MVGAAAADALAGSARWPAHGAAAPHQTERKPDLAQERQERDRRIREAERAKAREQRRLEAAAAAERAKQAQLRSYESLMDESKMKSNTSMGDVDYRTAEENFM